MSRLIKDLCEVVKEEFEGVDTITERDLILLIGPFGYELLLKKGYLCYEGNIFRGLNNDTLRNETY